MTPSKTYLKFQETRSKEDLDTLNGYLLRLQQISVILNGDTELSNEEENKLYDEDETLTDKVLRLLFGDNQDKAYQEIIDQVNAEYGDGGVLQFYSLQGIKEYFEIVHIQTQELTSIGFKTAILDL